jgi:hypothetical protein
MTDDKFSSVEAMLRWQLAEARRRLANLTKAFANPNELYSLPKSTDGLPEHWAWGRLTHHQVNAALARRSMGWCKEVLAKADEALDGGRLPEAIFRIIQAIQDMNALSAQWQSAASVRTYRYVKQLRKRQSQRASKPRTIKPTKEELERYIDAHVAMQGHKWGWQKQACNDFGLSNKTLLGILNPKNILE